MKHLFENIAVRLGEGVSGIQLEISKDGKLLQASIVASRWRMTVTIRLPRLIIWLMETME